MCVYRESRGGPISRFRGACVTVLSGVAASIIYSDVLEISLHIDEDVFKITCWKDFNL